MGDLKEELLKAGLVDRGTLEQAKSKRREARKRIARVDRRSARQSDGATDHPHAEFGDAILSQSPAGQEDVRRLVVSGKIGSVSGNRRFYFVDRRGRIPFLELNETTVRGLTEGSLAIVETTGDVEDKYLVVTAVTAERIETLNKDLIRFWNRPE